MLYPAFKKRHDLTLLEHIVQSARLSSGIGLGVSLGAIKLLVYWNLINFGTMTGDIERKGFSFTIAM